jgi:hypothetical protein
VAIVISEETGAISLTMDGGIVRRIEPDELRLRLAPLMPKTRAIESRDAGYSLS